jgi:hypothetical protein
MPMVEFVTEADHLHPVECRRPATTDPLALNLFRQLQKMNIDDCRCVLAALDGRMSGASSERIVLVRLAVDLFYEETDAPLTKKRYERWRLGRPDAQGLPSATFIANTWTGAWSQAMDKLGVQPAPDYAAARMAKAGPSRSNEEMLEHLRLCAAELGHTPQVAEYASWKREKLQTVPGARYLGEQTYRKRFGGWGRALIAAGLPLETRASMRSRVDWESDQPLQILRDATAEVGSSRLTTAQYEAWRKHRLDALQSDNHVEAVPAAMSITAHFGGWFAALAAAGLMDPRTARNLRRGAGRAFTDTELGDIIARYATETAGPVTSRNYSRWCRTVVAGDPTIHMPNRTMLGSRCGGWGSIAARVANHRGEEDAAA